MRKILNSLQTQLTAAFVLLIIVVAGGSFIFTFGQTKKALLEITRDDMLQIIGMASTQFSAQEVENITQFKAGQDSSPEYLALKKKLQGMRALSPNVINFYIMQIQGDKIVFFADDIDDDPALIGQVYEEPEAKLFGIKDSPIVSDEIYTDEWGTFLSGYAPLKNSQGQNVLIIGGDMDAKTVIERQNFIGNTIYLIMGLGILIAALIIGVFSITIIRDINKLNITAQKISMGDTDVSVNVKRKDEIGELAESFQRMVASLKIMMATDVTDNESNDHPEMK